MKLQVRYLQYFDTLKCFVMLFELGTYLSHDPLKDCDLIQIWDILQEKPRHRKCKFK
jgi:hypothetical protein